MIKIDDLAKAIETEKDIDLLRREVGHAIATARNRVEALAALGLSVVPGYAMAEIHDDNVRLGQIESMDLMRSLGLNVILGIRCLDQQLEQAGQPDRSR
jgi:ABC-type iron transport system FetAB permease component